MSHAKEGKDELINEKDPFQKPEYGRIKSNINRNAAEIMFAHMV